MLSLKKLIAYPFALILIFVLKGFSFLIKNNKGRRLLALSSAYAELTSARSKSLDKNDLMRDYNALFVISESIGLTTKKSSLELPLFMQRFFSFILGRNIFWKDDMLIVMIDQLNKEYSQSTLDKFAQKLYDYAPKYFKYDDRDAMINDLRKIIISVLPSPSVV